MKKRVAQFATEAEMCARFIALATGVVHRPGWESSRPPKPTGWISYPETAGWDILLVRERDGLQIGFEAKLRLNDHVIMQALEPREPCAPGPDCRAVLVPHGTGSELHRSICHRMGIQVVTIDDRGYIYPEIPREDVEWGNSWNDAWPQMLPSKRCPLPDFVPDAKAGTPSPLTLTPWKIKAIKLACILERRGWVCRQDFKHLDLNHRLFVSNRWIVTVDGAYRRGPQWPDFRRQHPRNFGEIDALWEEWKPPELPAPQQATYGRLL